MAFKVNGQEIISNEGEVNAKLGEKTVTELADGTTADLSLDDEFAIYDAQSGELKRFSLQELDESNLIGSGGASVASLSDIGDVDTDGLVDGQVLVYNSASGNWVPQEAVSPDAVANGVFGVFEYRFSDSGSTPDSGRFIESASTLVIHYTDNVGADQKNFFDQLSEGTTVRIAASISDTDNVYTAIAGPITADPYRSFTGLVLEQGALPPNDAVVLLTISTPDIALLDKLGTISDVVITGPEQNEFLVYDTLTQTWINRSAVQVGVIGASGPEGPIGPEGATGIEGPIGPEGATGLTGNVGPAGPQGINGEKGETGDQGLTGATGPEGDTGATGPQGATGVEGPIGSTGLKGDDGIGGAPGDVGPLGPTGATGIQGIEGIQGATGLTGGQGLKGDDGDQGATGPKGDVGDTGGQGATGLTGQPGPAGTPGDGGSEGTPGASGPPGATGEQGASGPAGATGEQGAPGPKGDDGDQGTPGVTGATGATGIEGPVGVTGATGIEGPVGAPGPQNDVTGNFSATGNIRAEGNLTVIGAGPHVIQGTVYSIDQGTWVLNKSFFNNGETNLATTSTDDLSVTGVVTAINVEATGNFIGDGSQLTNLVLPDRSLDELSDVSSASANSGDNLVYNGTSWVTAPAFDGEASSLPALSDIDNVNDASKVVGSVLLWDGSAWIAADAPTGELPGIQYIYQSDTDNTVLTSGQLKLNAANTELSLNALDADGVNLSVFFSSFTQDLYYTILCAYQGGSFQFEGKGNDNTPPIYDFGKNGLTTFKGTLPANNTEVTIQLFSSPSPNSVLNGSITFGAGNEIEFDRGILVPDNSDFETITADGINVSGVITATSLDVASLTGDGSGLTNLPLPANLSDIGDVSAELPETGERLTWNGIAWEPQPVEQVNAVTEIDDLSDVDTTTVTPQPNEVLAYVGGIWKNQSLEDLGVIGGGSGGSGGRGDENIVGTFDYFFEIDGPTDFDVDQGRIDVNTSTIFVGSQDATGAEIMASFYDTLTKNKAYELELIYSGGTISYLATKNEFNPPTYASFRDPTVISGTAPAADDTLCTVNFRDPDIAEGGGGSGGGATLLDGLEDVSVPNPQTNDFLGYNGTNWTSVSVENPTNIEDLSNVSDQAPNLNDALTWDGSIWKPLPAPTSGGGDFTVAGVPQNGHAISYIGGQWTSFNQIGGFGDTSYTNFSIENLIAKAAQPGDTALAVEFGGFIFDNKGQTAARFVVEEGNVDINNGNLAVNNGTISGDGSLLTNLPASGGGLTGLRYEYVNTFTNGSGGNANQTLAGEIRFDNLTLGTVTELGINTQDFDGGDQTAFLGALTVSNKYLVIGQWNGGQFYFSGEYTDNLGTSVRFTNGVLSGTFPPNGIILVLTLVPDFVPKDSALGERITYTSATNTIALGTTEKISVSGDVLVSNPLNTGTTASGSLFNDKVKSYTSNSVDLEVTGKTLITGDLEVSGSIKKTGYSEVPGAVPIGGIIWGFFRPIDLEDYLLCDGSAIAGANYPELRDVMIAINTANGNVGAGPQFYFSQDTITLPDFRGQMPVDPRDEFLPQFDYEVKGYIRYQ